ncbi:CheR family methyltransferase [Horticoccus sp. 23ND18S-11]|uniref:CheR family methyltransferase n=1 Tax=Horticoccus sp. 23ND18S-11 TaxID=3391832 RepID=UPI0039C909F0
MTAVVGQFNLSQEAYEFIAKLVYAQSRIRLGPDKQALVSGRLAKRLRHLRLRDFDEYCVLLQSAAGAAEIGPLVDVISTNHTHFFRESGSLDFLRDHILPEWKARPGASREPFRIWSAACSSGEEPYTLAIVLAEFARANGALAWQIEASDISTRILAQARAGVFATERVKLPDPTLLSRYFQKGVGANAGQFRVKDALSQSVRFHQLNLLQAQYPVEPHQHVIFCRNVMIYFDQETQQQLVAKLHAHLVPGGYLVVGHSESLLSISHKLKQVRPAIYRRDPA